MNDLSAAGTAPRYPGAPPFSDSDIDRRLFCGREQEASFVLHSILSERLVVVYGRSGMGKTSLLHARVLHELRSRDFWPIVIRLNDPSRTPAQLVVEQIEDHASGEVEVTGARRSEHRMFDYLSDLEIWRDDVLLTPVLVFDQFEELFNARRNVAEREEFLVDFADVARGWRAADAGEAEGRRALPVRVVLIIREDFLGELEAVAQVLPAILNHRFRLTPLGSDQAREAVEVPAALEDPELKSPPFAYGADAIALMLSFLRGDGGDRQDEGQDVIEPSQLQIICQHIEDVVLPGKSGPGGERVEITADDLGGPAGLSAILETFYSERLGSFSQEARRAVRRLCEEGLISPDGRRLSLEEGIIQRDYGLDTSLLSRLVAERLVRSEPRLDSLYYELAHDTLVNPILAYRQRALEAEAELRRRRNRWFVLAGVAVLAAVVTGVVVWLAAGERTPPPPDVVGQHREDVGTTPVAIALGHGSAWISNLEGASVSKVTARDLAAGDFAVVEIPIPDDEGVVARPDGIAVDTRWVWVANSATGRVHAIDPVAGEVALTSPILANTLSDCRGFASQNAKLAAGFGGVWVTSQGDDAVVRWDSTSGVAERIQVGGCPLDIAASEDYVWVSNFADGTVSRIDPESNEVEDVAVGKEPLGVAAGSGSAWVANNATATVTNIDEDTLEAVTIGVGEGPDGVAVGTGAVWITNNVDDTIIQASLRSPQLRVFNIDGFAPDGIAVDDSAVWVVHGRDSVSVLLLAPG